MTPREFTEDERTFLTEHAGWGHDVRYIDAGLLCRTCQERTEA